MKIYDLIDGEEKSSVGCLIYFEKEKSCIIELQNYLDEWTAPLLFSEMVKQGKFTINRELSRLWIRERVIPSDRQNIDSILGNAKMHSYDEMILLEKANGKCSQDSIYIQKRDSLPEYAERRIKHNLAECVPCPNHSLLCFFNDGTVKKVDLYNTVEISKAKKITTNESVFQSVHIAAGGYCITFNDSIDIEADILYEKGIELPLSLDDFLSFVRFNILDSSECCDVLECSRQNLTNYVAKDVLVPVKRNVHGNLYTKGNIYNIDKL